MAQINTNVISLNAQRNLSTTQSALATSIQRLSSGLRVNSAKDDAAGLAIAERMNAQVRGMNVAIRNANDGISLAQTAEGALGKVGDMLQRMRELAVQSANATNSDSDRTSLQKEFGELQSEVKRVLDGTKFNGKALFTGSASMTFQVGAGTSSLDQIDVAGADLTGGSAAASGTSFTDAKQALATIVTTMTSSTSVGAAIGGLKTAGSGSGSTATAAVYFDADDARKAMDDIDQALDFVNGARAKFGAVQNRFESAIATLQVNVENQAAARGRIMDTDFAAETANLSRAPVLQQAGMAMLSQANAVPQNVLSLLR